MLEYIGLAQHIHQLGVDLIDPIKKEVIIAQKELLDCTCVLFPLLE